MCCATYLPCLQCVLGIELQCDKRRCDHGCDGLVQWLHLLQIRPSIRVARPSVRCCTGTLDLHVEAMLRWLWSHVSEVLRTDTSEFSPVQFRDCFCMRELDHPSVSLNARCLSSSTPTAPFSQHFCERQGGHIERLTNTLRCAPT